MRVALFLLLFVIPARDVDRPPADPCGVYLSHHGTDADAMYQVQITRERGVLRTAWGTLGDNAVTHYAGTLTWDAQAGKWVETYDAGPTVRSCSPWRWSVVSEPRQPLVMRDDHGAWGWDLQAIRPVVFVGDDPPQLPGPRPKPPSPDAVPALKLDWHPDLLSAGKEVALAAKQVVDTGKQVEKTAAQIERTAKAVEVATSACVAWAPTVLVVLAMLVVMTLAVWFYKKGHT